ncbi:hypothetical protein IQ266_22925 [filamentous cyanobacterium LEGE 11480]|uniref:Uncharacterized protein n=1 Tax=Romeriopsis navalis LEGE 11480 TaxID=2777977 RepID=A0A928Z4G6_9CYAN|nr:hypothetical protein [Romeriopsis navalis]MBE9032596.1 hypothetical protein [Romeriopsis navalis LEGE 11480]
MKVSGNRVAGGALILLGFLWLLSLFLPKNWTNRTANQVNSNGQTNATSQNFNAPNGTVPLADTNQETVDGTAAQQTQQAPQTINSPDQSASPSPSPTTASPSPTPEPTFEPTPQPTPQPSPSVVPNPINAGW